MQENVRPRNEAKSNIMLMELKLRGNAKTLQSGDRFLFSNLSFRKHDTYASPAKDDCHTMYLIT